MKQCQDAAVAIIGIGGMGLRHIRACKNIGARVVAICDSRDEGLRLGQQEVPEASIHKSADAFVAAIAGRIDLVSVVANTPARAGIILDLVRAGIPRILTEKPFTTNVADAHVLVDECEKSGTQLTVNTYRHFCDNHIRLRDIIRSGMLGAPRHIAIHSASTGLGNMGSVFFDIMNFYLESRPIEVAGEIDKTGTPSVRGPQFRDPGGAGIISYESGARGFIDTFEDTGVPYTFHIVTTYGRIFIDELFNRWHISVRSEEDKKSRPLTFYLSPLSDVPFEVSGNFDPVKFTGLAMAASLDGRESASNARKAVTVMEMIMAMHVSDAAGRVPVKLPLDRAYHNLDIPFA